jgi:hypothetical protein
MEAGEKAMSSKRKPHPVVELAEVRSARTMAATQKTLAPEITDALSAEDLARHVAEQLAALPGEDRSLLRRKMLVAVHDLEGLVDALQTQLNGLAHELRKVSSHTNAATAYGRCAGKTSDKRS